MLPSKAKKTLAANLRLLSGGTDTQSFRERISKKSGGRVSPRTIGSMMSGSSANPTLANLEAVAEAAGITLAQLLSENLGRGTSTANHASDSAMQNVYKHANTLYGNPPESRPWPFEPASEADYMALSDAGKRFVKGQLALAIDEAKTLYGPSSGKRTA